MRKSALGANEAANPTMANAMSALLQVNPGAPSIRIGTKNSIQKAAPRKIAKPSPAAKEAITNELRMRPLGSSSLRRILKRILSVKSAISAM